MLNDKFHELMMPSCTNGVVPQLWFVEAVQASLFLLNDKHGILGTTARPIDTFYFPSLMDAFSETFKYYIYHGEPFPYHDEYAEAIQAECAAGLDALHARKEPQSEIMEFV